MKPYRHFSLLTLAVALIAALPAVAGNSTTSGAYEIWITNQTRDRIEIYASGSYQLLATIAADSDGKDATSKPHMILFSPDRNYAYVANVGAAANTNNLAVIDTRTRQLLGSYGGGPSAHVAVPSPDGKRVWLVNIGGNNLTEYLVGTGGVLTLGRTISSQGTRPICGMFTADSAYFYLTNGGNPLTLGSVVVIRVSDGQPVVNSAIGREGCGTVRSSDDTMMYVNAGFHSANPLQLNDEWWAFDTRTHAVVAQGRGFGKDMHGLAENPAGTQMWMVSRQTNTVNVFDTRNYDLLATYLTGDRPDLIAFSPDGSLAFFSRRGSAATGDVHALSGKDAGFAVMRTSDGAILTWVSTGSDDIHGLNVLSK